MKKLIILFLVICPQLFGQGSVWPEKPSKNNQYPIISYFPRYISGILFYTDFTVIEDMGIKYFRDRGRLRKHAICRDITFPYDSISLNTDTTIQKACDSAGCFAQFFNGASPDPSNTAKIVLIADIVSNINLLKDGDLLILFDPDYFLEITDESVYTKQL